LAVLGALRGSTERDFPAWLILRAPQISEVTGTVASYPSLGEGRIRFVLQPDQLPARILVTWSSPGAGAGSVRYGDKIELSGRTERPGTFNGFDYARYLERQDIFATMWVDSPEIAVLGSTPGILRVGDEVRQTLLGSLRERLTAAEFALAQSYVFGDRFALSDETQDAFAKTGLMHILAARSASGRRSPTWSSPSSSPPLFGSSVRGSASCARRCCSSSSPRAASSRTSGSSSEAPCAR
jgi:predicted membrane metal-binding protein